MKRITGRRTCKNCQAVYHVEFNPPKVDGVCDACGGEVVQRADDADEAAVARRLDIYFEQTTPVIDYYRGKKVLKEVDGSLSIEACASRPCERRSSRNRRARPSRQPSPSRRSAKKAAKKAPVKKAKPAKKSPAKKAATKKATRK